MGFFAQFLIIRFQQFNGLFEWFEHGICGGRTVFHSHQVAHTVNKAIVISLFNWFGEATISCFDERG